MRLYRPPPETTVDGETWLTGFIRFGTDDHVRGRPHQARPKTAYEHAR